MSGKDMNPQSLENDKKLCNEIAEILHILTKAEKQDQSLYDPLKQISGMVNNLKDDHLIYLNQRLLRGFQNATTHEQIWADNYFTFILKLCDLFNITKWKINHASDNIDTSHAATINPI